MKFQPDAPSGLTIQSYGAGWVVANGEKISESVILTPDGLRQPWNCAAFENLEASHFELLLDLGAEVILFGSGERLRFVHPSFLQNLYARRIGVETMDTGAACRTFNFLAGEGRKVAAALLL